MAEKNNRRDVVLASVSLQGHGGRCTVCSCPTALKEVDLILKELKETKLHRRCTMSVVIRAYKVMMPDGPRIGANSMRGHLRTCRAGWNE